MYLKGERMQTGEETSLTEHGEALRFMASQFQELIIPELGSMGNVLDLRTDRRIPGGNPRRRR
jgi:hypothetical protein